MRKLSKERVVEKEARRKAVDDAHAKLAEEVVAFNEATSSAWSKVEEAKLALAEAVGVFNDARREAWSDVETAKGEVEAAVSAANGWLEEVREEAQSYFDERTEKWQEGDAGSAYAEWISGFENALEVPDGPEEPDDIEEPELDEPEELEVPENPGEPLDEIAEEPGG